MYNGLFHLLWPITISLFVFELEAEDEKSSVYHDQFPFPLAKKIRRPAADSILMPPTFPIARLNPYTPNFSGVLEVDLVLTVWPPDLP